MKYAVLSCVFLTLNLATLHATPWTVSAPNPSPEVRKAIKKFSEMLSSAPINHVKNFPSTEVLTEDNFWYSEEFSLGLFSRAFHEYGFEKRLNQSNRKIDCLLRDEKGNAYPCLLIKYNTRPYKRSPRTNNENSKNLEHKNWPVKLWVLNVLKNERYYGWFEEGLPAAKPEILIAASNIEIDNLLLNFFRDIVSDYSANNNIIPLPVEYSFQESNEEETFLVELPYLQGSNAEEITDYYEELKETSVRGGLPLELKDFTFLKEFMSEEEAASIFNE